MTDETERVTVQVILANILGAQCLTLSALLNLEALPMEVRQEIAKSTSELVALGQRLLESPGCLLL